MKLTVSFHLWLEHFVGGIVIHHNVISWLLLCLLGRGISAKSESTNCGNCSYVFAVYWRKEMWSGTWVKSTNSVRCWEHPARCCATSVRIQGDRKLMCLVFSGSDRWWLNSSSKHDLILICLGYYEIQHEGSSNVVAEYKALTYPAWCLKCVPL